MDIGIGGFETAGFGDFEVDVEDIQVKKKRKYDRIWKVTFGGSVCGRPVFHNGMIIFSSLDNHVYAYDFATKKEIWRFKGNGVFLDSSPKIHENTVLVGSFDGNMYCLDTNTGKEVWKYKTGGEINTTAFISGEKVYFGSKDGYAYALDIKTGSLIWRYNTGDAVTSSPVVIGEKMIIGSFSGFIYCLNSETGKEIWRFKTGAEIENDYPFLVHNGILYFGSFDNYLYAIEAETGKEIWRFRTGKYGNCGIPTLHDNILYYGSRDGILYALSLDGKELWRFQTGKEIIDKGPLVYNGRIYFGAGDGNVYCLSIEGKELWRFRTNGGVYTSVVVIDGTLCFGSWDCHLYLVNPEDGSEIYRFQTSTNEQSFIPEPFECFEMEVKKDTGIEETVEGEKYKKKKEEESISLSDYQITSEYSSESEYKQKSDYDVSFVMFENVLEVEGIWTSDLKVLKPQTLMQR
jgi:outer membrane protein assembly factor BamB